MTTTIITCKECNTTVAQMNYEYSEKKISCKCGMISKGCSHQSPPCYSCKEQQFHEKINRNICLHCDGSGIIDKTKPPSLGNTCPHCMGTGKRFKHLLKDGILEF